MNTATTERLVRFQHPEKVLGYLGGLDDERLAALFGLDGDSYRRLRQGYGERTRDAAADLLAETGRNLHALRHLVARRVTARWVWITPSAVDEARVAAYPPFQRAGLTWANRDIDAIGRIMRAQPDLTVDGYSVVARRTGEGVHLDDGLHLSLAGQRALTAALVDTLTDRS